MAETFKFKKRTQSTKCINKVNHMTKAVVKSSEVISFVLFQYSKKMFNIFQFTR